MPEVLDSLIASWSTTSQVTFLDAVRLLLAAFVCGQVLAWSYERTYRGLSYSRSFGHTIVLITVASAAFVMAIGRNFYAGLGLLGVLSMIRFRTNLKTPRDLVFLLGGATSGVASGIDSLMVAAAGTLAFRVDSQMEIDEPLRALLLDHCRRTALMSVGEVAQGREIEHTYQVKFQSEQDRSDLMTALREKLKVRDARLLLQEVTLEY